MIGMKWVFKVKHNSDGSINKFKVRLVVKDYTQEYEVDFKYNFTSVVRHDKIRLLIAFVAQNGWKIFQIDVKSALLNEFLKEDIYVKVAKGSYISTDNDKVYKFHKVLYGSKQCLRACYNKIDD